MSELAVVHLRQGRSFLRAGDPERAIELLDKARVLARGDRDLQAQVLEELAGACDAVGRWEDAGRCRDQLARLRPVETVGYGGGGYGGGGVAAGGRAAGGNGRAIGAVQLPPSRSSHMPILLASLAALMIGGGMTGLVIWLVSTPTAPATTAVTPAAPPANPQPPKVTPAATLPASRPAVPRTPVVRTPATIPFLPAPLFTADAKLDRQQLLKDNVALCVTVVRYEGPVSGKAARIDIAVSSGTAFAVHSSGIMLTNRHVVEMSKDPKDELPITLEAAGLPTLVLRDTSYVVCFGSNPADRYPAKVLHRSDQFDAAILQVSKRFNQPLTVATKALRQGDDIIVCGFPGAVTAALNSAAATPQKVISISRKWQTSRQVDAFDEFSPDSFNSTLTRGIISAPERNVRGVSYVQIDAAISPGNSGGPVLNQANEVIGIATFGLRSQTTGVPASYNFALQLEQLQDELKPYLRN